MGIKMIQRCKCGGQLRVVKTHNIDDRMIWRKRVCGQCRKVIYTAELAYQKPYWTVLREYRDGKIFKKADRTSR